jgi:UDP-4-amino-4-deoxy-L-arabinose formyltransferase/UDP-glucuronic acid dehydrogenase (UDP-4-keto-hexauronic acid decarboxylating)
VNNTVIIPPEILALFPGRALNAHPGLLPEYAGLHVHQWAIRNGESEFGVTVHVMVPAIDAGPVVAVRRFAVQPNDTGLSLFRRCQAASAELLTEVATRIARGEALTLQPQDLARRHVYRHRDALDGAIDWRMPARAIIDFVRAGNYEPFVSPTYVASMPSASGTIVEVLRARIDESADAPPGTLLGLSDDGPRIACGDRETIRLIRARSGGRVLGPAEWRSFFEAHGCDSLG